MFTCTRLFDCELEVAQLGDRHRPLSSTCPGSFRILAATSYNDLQNTCRILEKDNSPETLDIRSAKIAVYIFGMIYP